MTVRAGIVLLALSLFAAPAGAETVVIGNDFMQARVNTATGDLVGWRICARECGKSTAPSTSLELVSDTAPLEIGSTGGMQGHWRADLIDRHRILLSRTHAADPDTVEAREFEVTGPHRLTVTSTLTGNDHGPVRINLPGSFWRESAHGFAGSHERIFPVAITGGQLARTPPLGVDTAQAAAALANTAAQQWVGFRNRYWAFAASAEGNAAPWRYASDSDGRSAHWSLDPNAAAITINLYAGPLSSRELAAADPVLRELMFGHLWAWLRWICFGLLWLLEGLYDLIGSWGFAIIALSLVVKILMTPFNALANRWQRQVNVIQSQLQPTIDAIKRDYKGEEQANRILAAHKALGVTPFYTLKGLAGLFFLIPVFLAAYNVLGQAVGLNGASFLWIDDLARPDEFLRLPFALPFFGGHLNLLPVLMTLVTLLASRASREDSLSASLQASRRRRLYGMALVFFVLFYTFPAGMVLYWTMNTVFQHVGDQLAAIRGRHGTTARRSSPD